MSDALDKDALEKANQVAKDRYYKAYAPMRDCVAAAIAAYLEAAKPKAAPFQGHDEPCSYCGEKCNSLAGNLGLWPLYFPDPDQKGTGEGRYHHMRCLEKKLDTQEPKAAEPTQGEHEKLVAAVIEDMRNSISGATEDRARDAMISEWIRVLATITPYKEREK